MTTLHIFGDSYSTPDFMVKPVDSWWGRLSTDMQLPCKVFAWPGNSMDNIAHAIVCYMHKKIHAGDYVAVGIPPTQRISLMKPEINQVEYIQYFDLNFKCIHEEDVLSHQGLVDVPVHKMSKDFIQGYSHEWANAQVIRNIALLDTFLQAHDVKVMFVNTSAPIVYDEWAPIGMLSEYWQPYDHIELTNTYYSVNYGINKPINYDVWGWAGHHGSVGNQLWYDTVIKPMAIKLGWIN